MELIEEFEKCEEEKRRVINFFSFEFLINEKKRKIFQLKETLSY